MSPGGRTTWWGKDAAWHRRELIVELGDEFGAEGPNVMDVLSSWAQEQRAAGEVRGGFRTLARESFVTVGHAQSIMSRAAEIGALDDLEIDPDGRRFKCRVSGWRSDQDRARAAARQAAKRNPEEEPDGQTVTDRDMSRPVTPSALPNHITTTTPPTPPGGKHEGGRVLRFRGSRVSDEQATLAEAILDEFNRQAATSYGAYTAAGDPSEDLKRILGALRAAAPPLTLEEAGRMIAFRLAHPYNGGWNGRPHTGAVFSTKVLESNRESARGTPTTQGNDQNAALRRAFQNGGAA